MLKPALGWDMVLPTNLSLFISCFIGLYCIKLKPFKFEYKYRIIIEHSILNEMFYRVTIFF